MVTEIRNSHQINKSLLVVGFGVGRYDRIATLQTVLGLLCSNAELRC